MTDDELRELRALQSRAYGRDGGLVGAELARLRDLERLRRVMLDRPALPRPADGPVGASSAGASADARGGADALAELDALVALAADGDAGSAETPGSGSALRRDGASGGGDSADRAHDAESVPAVAVAGTAPRRDSRLRMALGVAASVALLVAGVGIGAAVFGASAPRIELNAEHQGVQNEVEASGQFDAGSIEAVDRFGEAAVWRATRGDGEYVCVIVSEDSEWTSGCEKPETARIRGINASLHYTRDDAGRVVYATGLLDPSGRMTVLVQSHDDGMGANRFFAGDEERAQFDELVELGFAGYSLWPAGVYRERTVWSGYSGEQGQCLIYSAPEGPLVGCGDDGGRIETGVVDEDGTAYAVVMEWAIAAGGAQNLVVTQTEAEQFVVESESGDQVEMVEP